MQKEVGGTSYGQGVTPWHLCEDMQSSGNAHVDALRCDVIEYAFRKKGDEHKMIDDLEKAAHCATRAAEVLRKKLAAKNQPELPFAEGVGETLTPINGHRCRMMPPGPNEGLAVCVDCGKAEVELDEPCRATNGGGA